MNDYNKKFKKVSNQFVNEKQFSISTSKCVISSSCSQTRRFCAPFGQKYLSFIYSEGYMSIWPPPKKCFLKAYSTRYPWNAGEELMEILPKKQTAKFFFDTVYISFHLAQK